MTFVTSLQTLYSDRNPLDQQSENLKSEYKSESENLESETEILKSESENFFQKSENLKIIFI